MPGSPRRTRPYVRLMYVGRVPRRDQPARRGPAANPVGLKGTDLAMLKF
jgi:hypothetical protein